MKKRNVLLCCLLTAGCRETASHETAKADDASRSPTAAVQATPADKVPLYRSAVSNSPVAEYSQRTENPLNDWYFSVKLYETSKTFQYLMKIKYEEMEGEDTLFLPNVGTMPKPVIQKGENKYACIVGFMDNHDQFREYKKVYVKNDELKVTSLKHYSVATYEK